MPVLLNKESGNCTVETTKPVPPPLTATADKPAYWAEAHQALAASDPVMAQLIAQYHGEMLVSRGDAFGTLARSIVGQQISVKAADAVWQRFAAQVGQVVPAVLLDAGQAGLRGCGLSQRKIEYLLDLAAHFASGQLDPARWAGEDDETIIQELTGVRGIGRWTAEMFLIFHLMRPNVLPLDDVGLINGISRLYFSGDPVSRSDAREVAAAWKPWSTVATWYIWRSLDPLPVVY